MEKEHNQHNDHELRKGQEVNLGIRPHHLNQHNKTADHKHSETHGSHYAPTHQSHIDSKVHQASQHSPRTSHQHSPRIDLNPRPGSRVSPFRPTPKKRRVRESINAIRSHRHWHNAKLIVGTVLVFLLIFNSQWFISQFMYLFNKPKAIQTQTQTAPTQPEQKAEEPAQAELVGPNNEIIIPKIGVTAPLVFINTTDEAQVLVALRDGVVHYYGTANPGENGNAAFFGHSSNDWWEPGNYKFVFVLLEKLTVGDTYEIHYNSRKYVYKVTETKVVEPNDLSVLNQTSLPTSTLITCTPPGTSLKRFVVKADQIAPKPAQPAPKIATVDTTSTDTLPSAPPSIWQQLQEFFNGVFGVKKDQSNVQTAPAQPERLPEIKNL